MITKAPFSFGLILDIQKVDRPICAVVKDGNNPIVCCYCCSVIFKNCKFCPECGVKFKLFKSSSDFPKLDPAPEQISFMEGGFL